MKRGFSTIFSRFPFAAVCLFVLRADHRKNGYREKVTERERVTEKCVLGIRRPKRRRPRKRPSKQTAGKNPAWSAHDYDDRTSLWRAGQSRTSSRLDGRRKDTQNSRRAPTRAKFFRACHRRSAVLSRVKGVVNRQARPSTYPTPHKAQTPRPSLRFPVC